MYGESICHLWFVNLICFFPFSSILIGFLLWFSGAFTIYSNHRQIFQKNINDFQMVISANPILKPLMEKQNTFYYHIYPCIMRTPILDSSCKKKKKKKESRKQRKWLQKKSVKTSWFWDTLRTTIQSSLQKIISLNAPATKRSVIPVDSFGGQLL